MRRIGIVLEGNADKEPLFILLKRILHDTDFKIDQNAVFICKTGITGFINLYSDVFFKAEKPIDLGIFITDQDKQDPKFRRHIISIIDKRHPAYKDRYAVGVAIPHFESWLLGDEDYCKRYFGIPGNLPLPEGDREPKDRLDCLRKMKDTVPTSAKVRKDLASKLDINCLLRMKDFKVFYDELNSMR